MDYLVVSDGQQKVARARVILIKIEARLILNVHNDNGGGRVTQLPLTPDITGQDVLDCVRDPGYRMVHLVARWQDQEFLVLPTDSICTLLKEFLDSSSASDDEGQGYYGVQFIVRYEGVDTAHFFGPEDVGN
nr:hypothetical protein BaRGS_021098 [Batillaria attramentaria]